MNQTQRQAFLDLHGLAIDVTFVPYSRSRHAKLDAKLGEMSLNWDVKALHQGDVILELPCTAGISHCPAYPHHWGRRPVSVTEAAAIRHECETGRNRQDNTPIEPDRHAFWANILLDARAIDYAEFEAWADSLGYDPDSRKAERIYRDCLAVGLKLRAALGNATLVALQRVFEDY